METPTFEQQRETASKVITQIKIFLLEPNEIFGICRVLGTVLFLPQEEWEVKLIRKHLPIYYEQVGNEIKPSANNKRMHCMFWFDVSEKGHQQRIDSLKKVYNL